MSRDEMTDAAAVLFAAHSAVREGRSWVGDRHEDELKEEGRRKYGPASRILGRWNRLLALAQGELRRLAPETAALAFRLERMTLPGVTVNPSGLGGVRGAVLDHLFLSHLGDEYRETHRAFDLASADALPPDLSAAGRHLLRAVALLLRQLDGSARRKQHHELVRFIDPHDELGAVGPVWRDAEVDRLLDSAERDLYEEIVVDLSIAAEYARVGRRALEGLVRDGTLAKENEDGRIKVRLSAVKKVLGLPFLFPANMATRADGELRTELGHVTFVRGVAPTDLGSPAERGYLELLPDKDKLRRMLSRVGRESREIELPQDRVDRETLEFWVRAWSRERLGRQLRADSRWCVIVGREKPGGTQAAMFVNELREAHS